MPIYKNETTQNLYYEDLKVCVPGQTVTTLKQANDHDSFTLISEYPKGEKNTLYQNVDYGTMSTEDILIDSEIGHINHQIQFIGTCTGKVDIYVKGKGTDEYSIYGDSFVLDGGNKICYFSAILESIKLVPDITGSCQVVYTGSK